jgi:hypothetical protein
VATKKRREQQQRMRAVMASDDIGRDQGLERWRRHLALQLILPCEVTGIEDFQWEERYVIGPGDPEEYEVLRRDRPSYRDVYILTAIDAHTDSEWSLFRDDLKAHVRRKADGKRFVLGLSELKAVARTSPGYQSLDDYSVWFVNSR